MRTSYEQTWMEGQIPYIVTDVTRPEFEILQRVLRQEDSFEDFSLKYNPKENVVGMFICGGGPITGDRDIPREETKKQARKLHSILTKSLDKKKLVGGPWLD